MTVSMNSPSTNVRPSTSRPRPTKNTVTESRSATVIPTWSNCLICDMTAILRCFLVLVQGRSCRSALDMPAAEAFELFRRDPSSELGQLCAKAAS
jgi:hypothetical protein